MEQSPKSYVKIKILLVDDYQTNQKIVARHLTRSGYEVVVAGSGREAVDLFNSDSFDLILMDIEMPGMDGYQATLRIRDIEKDNQSPLQATKESARTPIVALTSHSPVGYREKCLEKGMDDFIVKPLKRTTLVELIQKHVTSRNEAPDKKNQDTKILFNKNHPVASTAPIDVQKLLSIWEEESSMHQILIDYLKQSESLMCEMEKAIKENNSDYLSTIAHKLKGALQYLAANDAADIASRLEVLGKHQQLDQAQNLFDTFSEENERIRIFTNLLKNKIADNSI